MLIYGRTRYAPGDDGGTTQPGDDSGLLPLLSDDGVTFQSPAAAGTGGTGGNSPPPVVGGAASGFIINVSYDTSADSAPAGFKTAIASVVQFLESVIATPITVNIQVGFGEINGQTLPSNALGASSTFLSSFGYTTIKNALAAVNPTVAATLPASAPGTMWLSTADAKALGLSSASTNTDGFVGFTGGANVFDYDRSNGISPGQYDFFGVVAHEFTEVLGRIDLFGVTIGSVPNSYDLFDMFHFSAPGSHVFNGSSANYFSINGGTTNLDNFNFGSNGGDRGDWAASAGNDSFLAFSNSGVVNVVSQADLATLSALGYSSNRLAVTATTSFAVQGAAPIPLLAGPATITDSNSTTISSATIHATNGSGSIFPGDEMFINGQQSGTVAGGAVTVSWNDNTKVLTLSGVASTATYQTLLGQVTYEFIGTDGTPDHTQHTITWTVNDGSVNLSTTSLIAIDHAPVAVNDTGLGAAGTTLTVNAVNGVLSNDTDFDHDPLTITAVNGQAANVGHAVAGSRGQLTLNADGSYSYAANAGAPSGTDAFTYTVSDAHSGSATATVSISFDVPPTITGTANAAFTEKGAAVTLSPGVTVSDPDNTNLAGATVRITGGTFAGDGDVLATSTAGTAIMASYNSTTETLILTGSDTLAHYQSVLDRVTFTTASLNPTDFGSMPTRTVAWTLNDGVTTSALATTTIGITAVNDPPTLASVAAVMPFHAGQTLTVSPALSVVDSDSLTLASATVKITGGTFAGDGDVLAANTAGTGITASYNSTTETLILTGTDTLADYSSVLDSVTFKSNSNPANSGLNPTRTLTWTVNDGAGSNNLSTVATNTISISPTVKNDFNADRMSDLVFQDVGNDAQAGTPQVWLMNGTSVAGMTTLANPGVNARVVATGDFDSDGNADILLYNGANGNLTVREMSHGAVAFTVGIGNIGTVWNPVGTGDFNGDGDPDILLLNPTNGNLAMWQMNGTSVAVDAGVGNIGTVWKPVGIGDFDGDGKSDILLFNPMNGNVAMWEMNGNAVTADIGIGNIGTIWKPVGTGDFNGDGKSDILLFNPMNGNVAAWQMNGSAITLDAGLGNVGANAAPVGTGDFNGDGKSDILFQRTDGTPVVWAMNGPTVTAMATLANPGPNWHANTG